MEMKLYNSLTKRKEDFVPIHPGKVGLYSCGPTVYGRPSIGNFRSFIFADTLRRVLEFNGFEVKHVMNITDVGHLVGDGDDGEDKLGKQARAEGKTAWEIAEFYTKQFIADSKALHILPVTHMPKATDHIPEQIALIEDLEKNEYTYKTSDGVYFDTSKLADYGKLSGQTLEDKQEGARVEANSEKRNPTDFALWKFSPKGEQRHMEWESPWGIGFPGWHIECSAMAERYLDSPFDIHTGGIDHIPVHHTNEIAQTQGARGNDLANVWMHNAFLKVDGGKMSKSLGNVYTIADIEEKGLHPLALRYWFFSAHYRSPMNFTWAALEAAQNGLNHLRAKARTLPEPEQVDQEWLDRFRYAVSDDLDLPKAVAIMHDMLGSGIDDAAKSATLVQMDRVLGLGLNEDIAATIEITPELQGLLDQRKEAREDQDWEKSDALRDRIAELGYTVHDTDNGQELR